MHRMVLPTARAGALVLSCLVLLGSRAIRADDFLPPRELRIFSESEIHSARITPATNGAKPLLVVFSWSSSNGSQEVWRTELSNAVMPIGAWISDDGQSVVTADNWNRMGYGDDVIAIYDKRGQVARYSLEEAAPPIRTESKLVRTLAVRKGYGEKFYDTPLGRFWRDNSIEFFHELNGQVHFCLWLDWDNRWLAFQMKDGRIVEVTQDESEQLKAEGRSRVVKKARVGLGSLAEVDFLGRLGIEEDRALVMPWLNDSEFRTSDSQYLSADQRMLTFYFTATSDKREAANRVLTYWGRTNSFYSILYGTSLPHRFLGTLKCVAVLPTVPTRYQGGLVLYLIPESISSNDWRSVRPEHYLIADFNRPFVRPFRPDLMQDGKLSQYLDVEIRGVTPGRYHLRAIWAKSLDYAKSKFDKVVYEPRTGDYESATGPTVSIEKGGLSKDVRIDCNHLVNRQGTPNAAKAPQSGAHGGNDRTTGVKAKAVR
ncbi:MAG TPA: hypothetical protein VNU68_32545 [Verrucomicrobiae bacterium]|nr:hypothetical protein [Verrucomicrobiae bacterium]